MAGYMSTTTDFCLRIWELNFLYIKFIGIVIICMCIVLHTKLIK